MASLNIRPCELCGLLIECDPEYPPEARVVHIAYALLTISGPARR